MDVKILEQWIAEYKHLEGQHNQRKHGFRGVGSPGSVPKKGSYEYDGPEEYGFSKGMKITHVDKDGLTHFSGPMGGGMYGNAATMVKHGEPGPGGMQASIRSHSGGLKAYITASRDKVNGRDVYMIEHKRYAPTRGNSMTRWRNDTIPAVKTEKFQDKAAFVKRLNEISPEWASYAEG